MRKRRMAMLLAGMMTLPSVLTLCTGASAQASAASSHFALITGSGSSWAANAVNQWISNVSGQGIQVVFTADGSAAGRQDYSLGTTDFGVSDIGYQGYDPVTGTDDVSKRPYAYLPVTAGGTAFPYHIDVGGKKVTNLRLSGQVIADIFTNQITNWDDAQITKDNNGHALPSLPITTVVPSEGSGTTAMFTEYLNYEFPAMWKSFNHGQSGMTEYWPQQGSDQIAQDGSSQIMNYIQSAAANGSIGIDEYSYPLQAGYPVVQMENAAGYYVLPTEYNDAVALTQAHINMDKSSPNYLLQNLNSVYGYSDPRTYPLSSYSYTIMPTAPADPRMAVTGSQFPAKWQTLADFLYYSICQGQEYIGPIGYSALPLNLVKAGFAQIGKIKKAAPKISTKSLDIASCHNPTFDRANPSFNLLAKKAPQPPSCDKQGQGPCSGILNGNANGGRGSSTKNGSSPSPSSSASTSPGASPGSGSGGSPGTTAADTGSGDTGPGGGPASTGPAVPTVLAAGQQNDMNKWLGPLAVILLLTALIAPPVLIRRWSRGRQL
jgi:phosphate transport system substrate-binding protein